VGEKYVGHHHDPVRPLDADERLLRRVVDVARKQQQVQVVGRESHQVGAEEVAGTGHGMAKHCAKLFGCVAAGG